MTKELTLQVVVTPSDNGSIYIVDYPGAGQSLSSLQSHNFQVWFLCLLYTVVQYLQSIQDIEHTVKCTYCEHYTVYVDMRTM